MGKKALELSPNDWNPHYFVGTAYFFQSLTDYSLENIALAVRFLKNCVQLKPSEHPAQLSLGWIYLLFGNYETALKYLERASEMELTGTFGEVTFLGALTVMGNLYCYRGEWETALSSYDRASEQLAKTEHVYRDPFLSLTYCGRAEIAMHNGQWNESIEWLRRSLKTVNENPKALGFGYFVAKTLLGLARAYHSLGDRQKAEREFRRALTLLSHKMGYDFSIIWEGCDSIAYYDVARSCSVMNRPEEALEFLGKAAACGMANTPLLESDPILADLRQEHGFKRIADRVKENASLLPE
jgi:tetratricopeptide (TPR) repeat protein